MQVSVAHEISRLSASGNRPQSKIRPSRRQRSIAPACALLVLDWAN